MKAEPEIKTYKIVSYCELDEDITNDHWINENSPDSYVEYEIINDDDLSKTILEKYNVEIGEIVLIYIDY